MGIRFHPSSRMRFSAPKVARRAPLTGGDSPTLSSQADHFTRHGVAGLQLKSRPYAAPFFTGRSYAVEARVAWLQRVFTHPKSELPVELPADPGAPVWIREEHEAITVPGLPGEAAFIEQPPAADHRIRAPGLDGILPFRLMAGPPSGKTDYFSRLDPKTRKKLIDSIEEQFDMFDEPLPFDSAARARELVEGATFTLRVLTPEELGQMEGFRKTVPELADFEKELRDYGWAPADIYGFIAELARKSHNFEHKPFFQDTHSFRGFQAYLQKEGFDSDRARILSQTIVEACRNMPDVKDTINEIVSGQALEWASDPMSLARQYIGTGRFLFAVIDTLRFTLSSKLQQERAPEEDPETWRKKIKSLIDVSHMFSRVLQEPPHDEVARLVGRVQALSDELTHAPFERLVAIYDAIQVVNRRFLTMRDEEDALLPAMRKIREQLWEHAALFPADGADLAAMADAVIREWQMELKDRHKWMKVVRETIENRVVADRRQKGEAETLRAALEKAAKAQPAVISPDLLRQGRQTVNLPTWSEQVSAMQAILEEANWLMEQEQVARERALSGIGRIEALMGSDYPLVSQLRAIAASGSAVAVLQEVDRAAAGDAGYRETAELYREVIRDERAAVEGLLTGPGSQLGEGFARYARKSLEFLDETDLKKAEGQIRELRIRIEGKLEKNGHAGHGSPVDHAHDEEPGLSAEEQALVYLKGYENNPPDSISAELVAELTLGRATVSSKGAIDFYNRDLDETQKKAAWRRIRQLFEARGHPLISGGAGHWQIMLSHPDRAIRAWIDRFTRIAVDQPDQRGTYNIRYLGKKPKHEDDY